MGVAGTVGVLKKRGHLFSRPITLRDTKLVVDVTDAFYWFVKSNLLTRDRPDLFGFSMVLLCSFYRDFFRRLRERNVTPIVVFSGVRMDEQTHGKLVSKHSFLVSSSRTALRNVAQKNFSRLHSLPTLSSNALKEVINELQLDHVHQSPFEVYPMLEHLAHQHDCPVLTAHSDFIFTNVPRGFVWFDDLRLPADSQTPLEGRLYLHQQMLDHFGCQRQGPALRSLYALLRDDFSAAHCQAVNHVLNLAGPMQLVPYHDRRKTQRLLHILQNWPQKLDSLDTVQSGLMAAPERTSTLERDYKGLMQSFTCMEDPRQLGNLVEACTRRESTASFSMELTQNTSFNRMQTVEDLGTFRSTYSLADRAKQYLLSGLHKERLYLFDRRLDMEETRQISAMEGQKASQSGQIELDRDSLYWLFHFDESMLQSVATELLRLQIDPDDAKRLALLLMLARFGYKLAFRENFDNNNQQRPTPGSQQNAGSQMGASPNQPVAKRYQEMRQQFYSSIVNSFVYHANHQQGDTSRQEIPADIRVARDKMHTLVGAPRQGLGDTQYFTIKHLIEMLNVCLHAYKELNSLHNFVGANFLVNKYYDGLLMYQIMRRWSNNLAGYLLKVEGPLLDKLSE